MHFSTKHDPKYAHNYHFHSSSVKESVTLTLRICDSFHKESTHTVSELKPCDTTEETCPSQFTVPALMEHSNLNYECLSKALQDTKLTNEQDCGNLILFKFRL